MNCQILFHDKDKIENDAAFSPVEKMANCRRASVHEEENRSYKVSQIDDLTI